MFCTYCGVQLHQESDRFCASCGRATGAGNEDRYIPRRRLARSMYDKKVAGVCGGLAEYLEVDVTLVRVVAVIGLIFSGGTAFLAYLVAWIIMPVEYVRPFPRAAQANAQA